MNRTSTRQYAFTLKYSFVTGDISALKCRACKALVDIHQPNPTQPDRILGTCPQCGIWYLIEPQAEGDRTLILQLPDPAEVPHPSLPAVK